MFWKLPWSDLSHVVKDNSVLKDMADFQKMNAIYGEFFNENFPARSTIQVAGLPRNGLVEIELVAIDPTVRMNPQLKVPNAVWWVVSKFKKWRMNDPLVDDERI
jgi:hypothetical protein